MKKSIGAQTILYPTPVLVVGTYDSNDKPNAMTVAWGGICSSRPPSVTIAVRSATYTHGNIGVRKCFTVNLPSQRFIKQADYFGMASGRNEDKFQKTGLTPIRSNRVDAPYIEEFPLVLECTLSQTIDCGLHTVFIGEIKDILVNEDVVAEDGMPDIEKIAPVLFAPGNRTYHAIGDCLGDAFSIGRTI